MFRGIPPTPVFTTFVCLTALFAPAAAENDPGRMEISFTARFSTADLVFDSRSGYDRIEIPDGNRLNVPGEPVLPYMTALIALPPGMEAVSARIIDIEEVNLPEHYRVYPGQPILPFDQVPLESDLVPPDERIYGSIEPYPRQYVELTGQTDLAGQGIARLRIYPLHYVPAEERLILLKTIDLAIEGRAGYLCGDYLPARLSESERESYDRMVREAVVNPDAVELRMADIVPRPSRLEPAQVDYVIIAEGSWLDDFQPLADWKTSKGVPARTVDRDWLYNEYGGSDDPEKIRAFIRDAHETWGTVYFLLGGDSNTIPYATFTNSIGSVPSDTYYSDYDSDWMCEVHVGRASVKTPEDIATFVDKVLTYEKAPPLIDYTERAAMFGFDLYHHDSSEGEACKVDIDNLYIPPYWEVGTVYDREPGEHKLDTIEEINSGYHLINHIDHCGWDAIGAGYINHRGRLFREDMDDFTNGPRQSILYVTGCHPCAFEHDDCVAEHFVRNENGGGLAIIGNTAFGWYTGYDDDYYSSRYDRYFFRSLFEQDHYRLGECFSDHKNDSYEHEAYYEYIFQELVLLGDPELPIWTENPVGFDTVTHPDSIPMGEQIVTVYAGNDALPVVGARVCLMKGSEVYAIGKTGSDGTVSLTIDPESPGSISVTVTARNHLPSEGAITVTDEDPDLRVALVPDSPFAVRGEMYGSEVTITNNSTTTIIADFWIDILLWNGFPFPGNPVSGPFRGSLSPGEARIGFLNHPIPSGTPLETYTGYGRVGQFPDVVWAEDRFEVTVIEPGERGRKFETGSDGEPYRSQD